jgi:hypothetical protein
MVSANHLWIASNPEHWTTATALLFKAGPPRDEFIATCCIITAAWIGAEWGAAWVLQEPVDLTADVFRLSFGSDWTDSDHVATVVRGQLTQSYYAQYEERTEPFTPELRAAVVQGDYARVAGVPPAPPLTVFQWVPVPVPPAGTSPLSTSVGTK